jgi:hypothetical protein
MGDQLKFSSIIRNIGTVPAQGVVAWISLVEADLGQPVDLEDWSAQKAVAQATLAPGGQIRVEWPMRPIQSAEHRVVISAAERNLSGIMTSPFLDLPVRRKPVVGSDRILPIAFVVPLAIGILMAWRIRRRYQASVRHDH